MAVVKRVDLHLWVSVILIDHLTAAIQVYTLCLETDNDIVFHSPIQINSEYQYEIYRGHFDCLFYQNGNFVEEQCMKAGQMERFSVKSNNTKDELTMTLTIRDVQKDDAGVYVLLVAQERDGEWCYDVIDVYIDVILPPEPVKCEVLPSLYSPDWNEVHCNASLGMDLNPQGSITCFQNGKKAPLWRSPTHSVNQIQAVFWMDVESSINCCSFTSQCDKPPELCLDFTYSKGTSTAEVNNFQKGGRTTLQQYVTTLSTFTYTESLGNNRKNSITAVLALTFSAVSFVICYSVIVFIIAKRYVRKCCKKHLHYMTMTRKILEKKNHWHSTI